MWSFQLRNTKSTTPAQAVGGQHSDAHRVDQHSVLKAVAPSSYQRDKILGNNVNSIVAQGYACKVPNTEAMIRLPACSLPDCAVLTWFDVAHPAARYTEGLERMRQVAAERSELVEALQQFDGTEVTLMPAQGLGAETRT